MSVTQPHHPLLMPEEGAEHERTWMAFGPSATIWPGVALEAVRSELATIANTIAQFEPVTVLLRPCDEAAAKRLLDPSVELLITDIDDVWARDTGATFVRQHSGSLAAVDFNFNGWGNKQQHAHDAHLAKTMSKHSSIEHVRSQLVMEGGGIEVDGQGTALITESCVLNDNRNPGWSKGDVEDELRVILGVQKVIWLPGIAGYDITDGHVDFYARFAQPGVVLAHSTEDPASFDAAVTEQHAEILHTATDAAGRDLRLEILPEPSLNADLPADYAASYINYYTCNGAIIAPRFGDAAADEYAQSVLSSLHPDRVVLMLPIDALASGGGGIHCVTQQQPLTGPRS